MKENNIEELKQMLEELYRTQKARLDVGADDLDIREEIAEVEEEIKELQDETMEENSIEKITFVENKIKNTRRLFEEVGCHTFFDEDLCKAIEQILSEYKRVLKENEELKQDRNNNYQMIVLAQNEVLGYMQGYEDGKKLKRSAIANIVENQQYYIIKKQIEKYETYIEQLRKELGQKDKIIDLMAETINNHDIDEDICKQMGQKANCNEFEDTEKCKDCLKQYFENKAKEIK